jgi:cytochrome b561
MSTDLARAPLPAERYSAASKTIHWLTVALVFVTVPLGLAMVNASPGPAQDRLYNLHWSFGATVLTVSAIRWLHRALRQPVAPPHDVPAWRYRIASLVHWLLYVLLIAVPMMGWAGKSAYGGAITYFGLFNLPPILPQNQPLAEVILAVHRGLAFTLVGLVVVHAAAAIEHHLRGDSVLRRMWPGG